MALALTRTGSPVVPDRIIRERATWSTTLDRLSGDAERLFWRLTVRCDDYGRFNADPRAVLALCFPLRVDRWRSGRVQAWLEELAEAEAISLYRVGTSLCGVLPTFPIHQRQRQSRPKFPAPTDPGAQPLDPESYRSVLEQLHAKCNLRQVAAPRGKSPPIPRVESRESRAESRETTGERHAAADPAATSPSKPRFRINAPILEALEKCPVLGAVALLRDPDWWQAEFRANNARGVDYAAELLKAEAWIRSNPSHAPKARHARFFHAWLARATAP